MQSEMSKLQSSPLSDGGEGVAAALARWVSSCAFVVSLLVPLAAAATGPIVIDPDYPYSFRYQSGERFFPMGDTAYFLVAQHTNVIARFIDVRRVHKFNFIRIMAIADGFWPFGGTPGKPDYTTINEDALRKLDWVFDCAAARDMNIELILWGYGVAGGEGLWTSETHQNFWIDTLVKRYRARPNLFMYTIANEFERYPDGKYEYKPADVAWGRNVATRIRRLDPARPVGCHPSVWITDQDSAQHGPRPSYREFTQRRPQIVWPLWQDSDVNLNVTQNNEGVHPRTWGNIDGGGRGLTYYSTHWQGRDYPVNWTTTGWEFEAAGLEDCIAEDRARSKPVLNTEFGYQHEPGYESSHGYTTRQIHQPATVRKKAWKIVTAGGYFAAGFAGTAVSLKITPDDVNNFRPASLEVLYDFFTKKTEYWKMAPHLELLASHNVLLAFPGTEYVAYFPRGGTNSIELLPGSYEVEWLHPETGRYCSRPQVTQASGSHEFVPPEHPNDDWVMHLRRRDRR
jgi:hypothetical protein